MGVETNAFVLAAEFDRAGSTIQERANRKTRHHAMLLTTRVKGRASGRPGPNVITGDYRRSWEATHAGATSIVGTNKPQARRLEYGFVGRDSLGRNYHQPPFPHVGPAVDDTLPAYSRDLLDLMDDV